MNVKNVINNIRLDKGFSFTLQNKTHEVRLTIFTNPLLFCKNQRVIACRTCNLRIRGYVLV